MKEPCRVCEQSTRHESGLCYSCRRAGRRTSRELARMNVVEELQAEELAEMTDANIGEGWPYTDGWHPRDFVRGHAIRKGKQ